MTGPAGCRTGRRRGLLRRRGINGIDAVEVGDDGRSLTVHFLTGVPSGLQRENVRLDGGLRTPRPRVVGLNPLPADAGHGDDEPQAVTVRLDRTGDAGPYRLCLVECDERGRPGTEPFRGFDPRYSCAEFSFTQICPSDLDCAAAPPAGPPPGVAAPRDYLARDFPTFRRLLLDRLALVAPGWQERRIPDLGITLVELLSYVADHLSYYHDAVATEAYLDTARQRISVRRHGRLVDHVLGEGTNARAFVTVAVDQELTVPVADVAFVTGYPGAPPVGRSVTWAELADARPGTVEEFRPLVGPDVTTLTFRPARAEIALHTWGDDECGIPAGATTATLVEDPAAELGLVCGDLLLFEEVRGRRTGLPADADPGRRHVVRLTRVEEGYDEATGTALRQVWWEPADALPFPLCLSTVGPAPGCEPVRGVAVARGDVLLVDHGRSVEEDLPPVPAGPVREECEGACRPAEVIRRAGRFRPRLARPDLVHAEPLPPGDPCGCGGRHGPPATALLARDPRAAVPALVLDGRAGPWTPVPDLLAAGPDDRVVVVEMDDERVARLRFGDDRTGEEPEPDDVFRARYRVGDARRGNVGAGAIRHLVRTASSAAPVRVRNPLPASGGTGPEPVAEAKLTIPAAFRAQRERAVTADDYAELARRLGGTAVQSAAADLVWTGSWYTAEVALDPRTGPPATGPDPGLDRRVENGLARYRRMGHDLRVVTADTVPVDLELAVCVAPDVVGAHVEAAIADLLSARVRRDGSLGWFHPDRWTFGQAVDISPIVAAVAGVAGVADVAVTRLARLGEPGSDVAAGTTGSLAMGRWEIAQLDPGAGRGAGGRLEIRSRGGR